MFVHVTGAAERELGATATGVEDHERSLADPEPRRHGQVAEAALLVARDDLDREPYAIAHGLRGLAGVARDPEPGGADGDDRRRAEPARLVRHPGDRGNRPLDRLGGDLAAILEPLAQPGDLGAVDDRGPRAVRRALADVELDRVRADVDRREPLGRGVHDPSEGLRIARVRPAAQADVAHRRDHGGGVLGFDRDRPQLRPVRLHLGELRGAAADRVPDSALVNPHGARQALGFDQLAEEPVERVGVRRERRRRACRAHRTPAPRHRSRGGSAAFITGSHRSRPSSFTSRRTLMSIRSSRTFTFSPPGDTR